MNRALDPSYVAELRKKPFIEAWIKSFLHDSWHKDYKDCMHCGWPHAPNAMCGAGSTFGEVRLGGQVYYVDTSNVEYLLEFVNKLGPGFHWKNEIFFDVKDGAVVVSRVEGYNNCPHVKTWQIPLNEWDSIVGSVAGIRERAAPDSTKEPG